MPLYSNLNRVPLKFHTIHNYRHMRMSINFHIMHPEMLDTRVLCRIRRFEHIANNQVKLGDIGAK